MADRRVSHRAKDLAERASDAVVVEARHRWQAFQRTNPFFKARAAVVGSWALMSLVTLALVIPEGEQNELGAVVKTGVNELFGGTFLLIENQSDEDWHGVELVLNGRYGLTLPELIEGETRTVPSSEFLNPLFRPSPPGLAWPLDVPATTFNAPFNTVPQRLSLRCREGRLDLALGE